MALVYSQMYDADTMNDVRDIIESDNDAATNEFESLPAAADEDTRARLAEKFAATITEALVKYSWMIDLDSRLRGNPALAGDALARPSESSTTPPSSKYCSGPT
ncbi:MULTISPECIES: hypothetical protein [unclassified Rhodococcus (in: high G+C Gram-positive bacteria)]